MNNRYLVDSFLNFFKKLDHRVVPSASLIPDDTSLLFTSAGMVPFKKYFLSFVTPEHPRLCSVQRCFRTSDIESVGYTNRHLTFFQMLGNFSIGDYFKEETIEWSLKFLELVGLERKNIRITVYYDDDESYRIWSQFFPTDHIYRMGKETNFWMIGTDGGPAGPCSEILYDTGLSRCSGCKDVNCDCGRYIEVWNLVFTQYRSCKDGQLLPLKQKNIDTGMGLERLLMVLEKKDSVFSIDPLKSIIKEIKDTLSFHVTTMQERLIADHIRSIVFLIFDGVLPSNIGHGYVLRRLIRRAIRSVWAVHKDPFLHVLAGKIVDHVLHTSVGLVASMSDIQSIILTEEKNSLSTIELGIRIFSNFISTQKTNSDTLYLTGQQVFNIYETYGIDKEIQSEIVKDLNMKLSFSESEYQLALDTSVVQSKKSWKNTSNMNPSEMEQYLKNLDYTQFIGYDDVCCSDARLLSLFKVEKDSFIPVSVLHKGDIGKIVLNKTPFYPEGGGQVGDTGHVICDTGMLSVKDTHRLFDHWVVHDIVVDSGTCALNALCKAEIDLDKRKDIMRHHTSTHLLHAVLRDYLDHSVVQSGSLVSEYKLRFDFTYPCLLSVAQLTSIESLVNHLIHQNIPRERRMSDLESSRESGALAFFGDKYGDDVYVVNYGEYSNEVCGGTHCLSTGDIGLFKIINHASVGSGICRIEAVTGRHAVERIQNQSKILSNVSEMFKAPVEQLKNVVIAFQTNYKKMEKELSVCKLKLLQKDMDSWREDIKKVEIKGLPYSILIKNLVKVSAKTLKDMMCQLRSKFRGCVFVLISCDEKKVSFVIGSSLDEVVGTLPLEISEYFCSLFGFKCNRSRDFIIGGGKAPQNFEQQLDTMLQNPFLLFKNYVSKKGEMN